MSWRDEVRPASFRGVPFELRELSGTSGRRFVADELPESDDLPPAADLGRRRPTWRIQAFVVGLDYLDQRDRLLAALNAPGPGELLHPYRGRLLVQVGGVEHSHAGHNACMLEFECVDAGGQARPFVQEAPAAAVTLRAAAASAAATSAFGAAGEASGAAWSEEWSALSEQVAFSEPPTITESLWGEALMGELAEAMQLVSDVRGLVAFARSAAQTVYRAAVTPSEEARNDAHQAMVEGLRMLALVRATEVAASVTYPTADAATEAMVELAAELSESMDGVTDQDLFVALTDLRTSLVDTLTAVAERLPRLRTITVAMPTPALVLAFDLYGSRRLTAREAELVKLNGIGHPGFVQGSLQVLSR